MYTLYLLGVFYCFVFGSNIHWILTACYSGQDRNNARSGMMHVKSKSKVDMTV